MNRRGFLTNSINSAVGVALGGSGLAFASDRETPEHHNLLKGGIMERVKNFRKIDAHAHVFFNLKNSPEAEVDYAERLGIDRLMISNYLRSFTNPTPEEFRHANDETIACVKKYPNVLKGTIVFNANYQKESLYEIDRCVDRGMVGLGELYTQVRINDPLYYPIVEKMIDLKMIILQHSAVGYSRAELYASEPPNISLPEDFVDIAKRYPEAMFQFAHIGGGIDWEYACKTLQHSPNVYVDVAGSNNEANMIDFAMKYLGEDRLLFACDGSFYQGVGHLFSAQLTDRQRRKIFFENYNNILRKSGNHVD